MLSILVTYYNQEKFVARSLDSIFKQNITESYEILVGDDGSQDNTVAIIKEYQRCYPGKITINIQQRNALIKYNPVERASKNRIDLLNMAKGDFVCFLDGDDEYCDYSWLQESIELLKKDFSIVGVAHNYCEVFPNGEKRIASGVTNNYRITARIYASQLYTPAGTILFRNIYKQRDYEKLISLKSFDDNDITYYFLNCGDLAYDNRVVYSYYQNADSIWHSTNNLEKAVINAIDYEVVKRILNKYHYQLLNKYYNSLSTVFNSKKQLQEQKYGKYKHQCVAEGIVLIILNWNEESIINHIRVNITFFGFKLAYCFQRVIIKFLKTR